MRGDAPFGQVVGQRYFDAANAIGTGFAHGRQFQHPMMNQMMLNSTFTMLTSARKPSLAKEIYFQNQEELLSLLNDRQGRPKLDS
jgi:hypothetical protein